jgi:chemotaxis protein CheD
MGELKVVKGSAVLVSRALGSCVALVLFDPKKKIGGLAHIMLPCSCENDSLEAPAKYADQAVPKLIAEMKKSGANGTLVAKLVGGARMFDANGSTIGRLGEKNVKQIRNLLKQAHIRLVASDVGGTLARTAFFDIETGRVTIRSLGKKVRRI